MQLDLCLFLVSGNQKQSKLIEEELELWESERWNYHATHREYFNKRYEKFFQDLARKRGNEDQAPHPEEGTKSCVRCSIIAPACACGRSALARTKYAYPGARVRLRAQRYVQWQPYEDASTFDAVLVTGTELSSTAQKNSSYHKGVVLMTTMTERTRRKQRESCWRRGSMITFISTWTEKPTNSTRQMR